MASTFDVIIEGDREVALRLDQFPRGIHDRLRERIQVITARLAGDVRAAVPRKTGRLASEVASGVRDEKDSITGFVTFSDEYAKAGALEYGAHRTSRVAAHQMQLTQVFGHRLNAPISVLVAAHSRQMNIVAHRFLRGPLQTERSEIEDELREVVDRATEQGAR